MDVSDLLLFLSYESLQQSWLLEAGRLPFVLCLLLISGFAIRQLPRRPRAMRWFLAALGITILWDGVLGPVVPPILSGIMSSGTTEIGLMETMFDFVLWTALPLAIRGVAVFCLLNAAFEKPGSRASIVPEANF